MDKERYIDGMVLGRPQSPAVEHAFQDALGVVVVELLQTKGLYQNVRVNSEVFVPFANDQYPSAALAAEFSKRPLRPHSRGEGDESRAMSSMFRTAGGSDPLSTPHDEMHVEFYLPNIQVECHRCNEPRSFLSMSCSGAPYVGCPHPILGNDTEQIFSLYYRCAACRRAFIVFQVKREGLKLQLTGRSTPHRPPADSLWPKSVRPIITDALVANAEGDTPAAYYHLRTALEFLMKGDLKLEAAQKLDGSDLCERYGSALDPRLRSDFPSLGPIYIELSAGLHSRTVDPARFLALMDLALDHLRAKVLFGRYASSGSHRSGAAAL